MSSSARGLQYTYQEYLALEEAGGVRHEYLGGEIYAMAGGSPDHAALAAALIGALRGRLLPGCRPFTSDLRVRIAATGLSTYPDVAVICGRTQRADDDALAVVDPVLLAEVTSAATEDYDRGEKLRHYQSLPSVREVLIASHREARLTLHRRGESGWSVIEAVAGESFELSCVAATLDVDALYEGLEDA